MHGNTYIFAGSLGSASIEVINVVVFVVVIVDVVVVVVAVVVGFVQRH